MTRKGGVGSPPHSPLSLLPLRALLLPSPQDAPLVPPWQPLPKIQGAKYSREEGAGNGKNSRARGEQEAGSCEMICTGGQEG